MVKMKQGDRPILFLAVLLNLSFLGTLLQIDSISSLSFYCSFFVVFWLFFRKIYTSGTLYWQWIFLLGLMLLSLIVSGLQSNFEYYKRFIITVMVFVCFEMAPLYCVSEKTKQRILLIFAFSGLVCECLFYFGGLRFSYFGSTNFVALNFSNPNAAAIWLCGLFVTLLFANKVFSNRKAQILILLVAALLIPIVWATESRNVMLACIVGIAWYIFNLFVKNWLPKWVIVVFVFLPAVIFFLYMYTYMPYQKFWEEALSFLTLGEGKSLGSRGRIWTYVQNDLSRCFLLGDYATYHSEQMHNSLMTLYCMFGAPSSILMCLLMIRNLARIKTYHSTAAVSSLCTILFTGCFEASIFVGVAGAYLFALLIPVLCGRFTDKNQQRDLTNESTIYKSCTY